MDRELLSRMICELIIDHDVVGLPGVGTFYAERMPAVFSDKGFTIHPPYRRLSFKPICTENQLLIDFYAEKNKVPIDIASEYITQFLEGLNKVLKDKKNVALPGLGRLRATRENNFFFVSAEDLDIFPETFALKEVSLKSHPLIEEKVEIPFSFKPKTVPVELETIASVAQEEPQQEPEPSEPDPMGTEPALPADQEPIEDQQPEEPDNEETSEPEIVQEETPEPETPETPETEPIVVPSPKQEDDDEEPKPKKKFKWWAPLLVIFLLALIALAALFVMKFCAPELLDTILYTPEELSIINY